MSVEQLAAYAGLGTAVGTALLAVATFVLARRTKAEVEAANRQATASSDQSAASLEQAKASHRQAELAEKALRVQTSPLLTDVPYGIPAVSGYTPIDKSDKRSAIIGLYGPKQPHFRDASLVTAYVDANGEGHVQIEVPFRNVGNGAAIVSRVEFLFGGNTGFESAASSPVVPAGEIAEAVLDIDPNHHAYAEPKNAIDGDNPFRVVISYNDADGNHFGAVRLDLDAVETTWSVRQVHWAKSRDEVLSAPAMSSVASS
jgi:hypothetical protein